MKTVQQLICRYQLLKISAYDFSLFFTTLTWYDLYQEKYRSFLEQINRFRIGVDFEGILKR